MVVGDDGDDEDNFALRQDVAKYTLFLWGGFNSLPLCVSGASIRNASKTS